MESNPEGHDQPLHLLIIIISLLTHRFLFKRGIWLWITVPLQEPPSRI